MPLAGSFDTPGWFTRDTRPSSASATAVLGADADPLPGSRGCCRPTDCFGLAEDGPARAARCHRQAHRPDAVARWRTSRLPRPISMRSTGHSAGSRAWRPGPPTALSSTRMRPALGPGIGERFCAGRDVTKAQVKEALAVRKAFRAHFGAAARARRRAGAAHRARPRAAAGQARTRSWKPSRGQSLRLLCLSGLSGFPQITFPAGERGAPFGLSLIGPPGSDLSLVRLAGKVAEGGQRARSREA